MKSRARTAKIAAILGALVILQTFALYVFREVNNKKRLARSRFTVERLSGDRAMPALEVERRDGSAAVVSGGGPRLIHFWATWCPPCVEEMPGFLEAAQELQEDGIEVLAVSADDDWPAIERFFEGDIPKEIVRARGKSVLTSMGVGVLPDAYLVSRSGKLIARYAGPRDWSAAAETVSSGLGGR